MRGGSMESSSALPDAFRPIFRVPVVRQPTGRRVIDLLLAKSAEWWISMASLDWEDELSNPQWAPAVSSPQSFFAPVDG